MPVVKQVAPKKSRSNTGNIIDQIQSVQDMDTGGLNLVVYGKSGTGKTKLASTAKKPALFLICSGPGETRTIKNEKGVDAVRITDVEQLVTIVEYQKEVNKYKTIVVDHATGFQDLAFKKVVGKDAPAQMSWGAATQQQWGEIGSMVKEHLKLVFDLPCDTIINCQERTDNADADASEILQPYCYPALSPSTATWLQFTADYVVHTFIRLATVTKKVKKGDNIIEKEFDEIQYCLRVGPHPTFYTKFRVPGGVKEDVIVNPTLDKIQALIGE